MPPPPPSPSSPPSPPWPPLRSHLGRRARRRQATGAWSSRPSLLLLLLCPPAGDWSKQTCRSSSCWKPRVAITGPLRSCFLRLPIYLALHTVLRITGQAGCFLSRHQLALPTSTSLRRSSFKKTQSSFDAWTHLSPIIYVIFRKSSFKSRIWLRFITSFCVLFSLYFIYPLCSSTHLGHVGKYWRELVFRKPSAPFSKRASRTWKVKWKWLILLKFSDFLYFENCQNCIYVFLAPPRPSWDPPLHTAATSPLVPHR